MGQLLSSRKRYRPRKGDGQYVLAINSMDWKAHLNIEDRQELDDAIMQKNMLHTNMPAAISSEIFISDTIGVCNLERLQELGITHVLNVAGPAASRVSPRAYSQAGIQYEEIDALDDETYPMLDKHWSKAQAFLQQARELKGKCVVHCVAGMNRSGLIVAADYMLQNRKNVLETVLHCRTCRGNSLLSNGGFQQELVALARQENLLGPAPGEPGCVIQGKLSSMRRGSKSIAQLFL